MKVVSTFDPHEGAELPHRVIIEIGGRVLHGAAVTKSDAVMAALSVAGLINRSLPDAKQHAAKMLWTAASDDEIDLELVVLCGALVMGT